MIEKALPLVGVTIILIILLYVLHVLRKDNNYRYKKVDNLLTKAELGFYHQLVQLLPQYAVMCKVRLADILEPAEHGRKWYYAFSKIRSKHVDFAVIEPSTSEIKAIIELDDKTHDRSDRINRDKFLERVTADSNINLMRFKAGQQVRLEDLKL